MVCSEALSRCVSADDPDRSAPELVGALIAEPPVGSTGVVMKVSFEVNEVLGTPPRLEGEVAGQRVPLVFEAGRSVPEVGAYVFSYAVTGVEGVGSIPLFLTLIDDSGNTANLEPGALTIDVTPPTVQNLIWIVPAVRTTVGDDDVVTFEGVPSADTVSASADLVDQAGTVIGSMTVVVDPMVPLVGGSFDLGPIDLDALAASGASELRAAVVVRDAVGNASTVAQTPGLTIDVAAPDTTLGAPLPVDTEISPQFTFTSPDATASFECELDAQGFAPCTSPVDLAELDLGTHTFSVRAVDPAGNIDPSAASHTWDLVRRWQHSSVGSSHTCALATDHTVWCWGENRYGQLGRGFGGPGSASPTPATVLGPLRWKSVNAGGEHTCAIDEGDRLYCWGHDHFGQLGVGAVAFPEATRSLPSLVGTDTDQWSAVALGEATTCGIREDGTLWCWGDNDIGQAGLDSATTEYSTVPSQVGAETDWLAVAVGSQHACGIRDDATARTAWCFGSSASGRLGGGAAPSSHVPAPVTSSESWVALALGERHSLGLTSAGDLYGWGATTDGRLFLPVPPTSYDVPTLAASGVAAITAAGEASCRRESDGSVHCAGRNFDGQVDPAGVGIDPSPSAQPVAGPWAVVALGAGHGCAVDAGGALSCWGRNDRGQLATGTPHPDPWQLGRVGTASDWTRVSAGGTFTCGTRNTAGDDTLWCWGRNERGELGVGLSTGAQSTPVLVDGNVDWQSVSAGSSHACGLRNAGTVYCWGENGHGQVGRPNSTPIYDTPNALDAAVWTWVSAGALHSCGVTGGLAKCWGNNENYELSTCGGTSCSNPQDIDAGGVQTDWLTVEAGGEHSCGIRNIAAEKQVWCWGQDKSFETGDPGGMKHSDARAVLDAAVMGSPIVVTGLYLGGRHSCAELATSVGVCWGHGQDMQLQASDLTSLLSPVPLEVNTPVQALTAGGSFTCRRSNSDLLCWGGLRLFPELPMTAPGTWGTVARELDAGERHVCVIGAGAANGELWCAGDNRYGQLGFAGLWSTPVTIAAP